MKEDMKDFKFIISQLHNIKVSVFFRPFASAVTPLDIRLSLGMNNLMGVWEKISSTLIWVELSNGINLCKSISAHG